MHTSCKQTKANEMHHSNHSMLGQRHIFKVFVSFCGVFWFFFYIFYLLVCFFLRATIMYSSSMGTHILLVDDF